MRLTVITNDDSYGEGFQSLMTACVCVFQLWEYKRERTNSNDKIEEESEELKKIKKVRTKERCVCGRGSERSDQMRKV